MVFFHPSGHPVPREGDLRNLARRVLSGEGIGRPVHVIFCENELVRRLNRDFRGLDRVTDVLSFQYNEEELHGELYISRQQALAQAPRWHNSFYQELKRLIVHGCLHLAGYDHVRSGDRRRMTAREDHYLGRGK